MSKNDRLLADCIAHCYMPERHCLILSVRLQATVEHIEKLLALEMRYFARTITWDKKAETPKSQVTTGIVFVFSNGSTLKVREPKTASAVEHPDFVLRVEEFAFSDLPRSYVVPGEEVR